MKRKSLKENYNTLAKSNDFGRVLFYLWRECCFILERVLLYIGEYYFLVTPSLLTYHTKV